jgi:hypothetical protein
MERTSDFVKIWFWPRGASNIPADVKQGSSTINTGNWVRRYYIFKLRTILMYLQGEPDAFFPNTDCDIDSHFGPNKITINLTFCKSNIFCMLATVLILSTLCTRRGLGRYTRYICGFGMSKHV